MGIHILVTDRYHLTNTFVVTATNENKFHLDEIHCGFLVIQCFDFAIPLNSFPNSADVLPQQGSDSLSSSISQQSLVLDTPVRKANCTSLRRPVAQDRNLLITPMMIIAGLKTSEVSSQ